LPDKEARSPYRPPTVTVHGSVGELTQSHGLILGAKALQFGAAFAASLGGNPNPRPGGGGPIPTPDVVPDLPNGPGGGGGGGVGDTAPVSDIANTPSGAPGGGGTSPGGGSGGGSAANGGGGGGKLPFTGLVVIGVAGVGAAFGSAGALLRRVLRRGDAGA
jgi:hypothetical protein